MKGIQPMNILIHDVNKREFERLFHSISKNNHIISDTGYIKNCVGGFGCWIKTPGTCVIKDGYENLGEIFSKYRIMKHIIKKR